MPDHRILLSERVVVPSPRLSSVVQDPSRSMSMYGFLVGLGLCCGLLAIYYWSLTWAIVAIPPFFAGVFGSVTYLEQLRVYNEALLNAGHSQHIERLEEQAELAERIHGKQEDGSIPVLPRDLLNANELAAFKEYIRDGGRVLSARILSDAGVFSDKSDSRLNQLKAWIVDRGLGEIGARGTVEINQRGVSFFSPTPNR